MGNLFRHPETGKLDKKHLRLCAVFRLLRTRRISRETALSLLRARAIGNEEAILGHWLDSRSFKHHWTLTEKAIPESGAEHDDR